MSRLWARIAGLFSSRKLVGMDKAGNRYFARTEEIDGIMKEKRWVIFKGEQDPTSAPVEWICWLNGQRKRAPTLEEMAELEARRERVRLNVAVLKKEEEERKAKQGKTLRVGKAAGPDLKSFVRQFPVDTEEAMVGLAYSDNVSANSDKSEGAPDSADGRSDEGSEETQKEIPPHIKKQPENSEPTGSGESFKPGTWQPPT